MKITREDMNKHEFLYHIYNDLGCTNLHLSFNYPNKTWSRWVSYEELMSLDSHEQIAKFNHIITRDQFIEKATHRTILDIEILLDIDDAKHLKMINQYYGLDIPEFESIKDKAIHITKFLDANGIDYAVHFTGNKSYHISVLIPKLREMIKYKRELFKRDVLLAWDCDTMCSCDRHMIAIEGALHYRSGKPKSEVMTW